MPLSREQLAELVIDYAHGYGIDPNIALEQIKRESANFRPDVVYGPFVGGAGERGMSQFTPGTWARFGYGPHTNAYDPDYAMTAWGEYMKYLLNMFNWNHEKALQGYNGGEGNVQRGTVSTMARNYAREIMARAGQLPAGQLPADQVTQNQSQTVAGNTNAGLPQTESILTNPLVWVFAGLIFYLAISD